MSIKFIDLFSGCGGLTEAFLNNQRFSPVKIIDNDKFCYETTINRLKNLDLKTQKKLQNSKIFQVLRISKILKILDLIL